MRWGWEWVVLAHFKFPPGDSGRGDPYISSWADCTGLVCHLLNLLRLQSFLLKPHSLSGGGCLCQGPWAGPLGRVHRT